MRGPRKVVEAACRLMWSAPSSLLAVIPVAQRASATHLIKTLQLASEQASPIISGALQAELNSPLPFEGRALASASRSV